MNCLSGFVLRGITWNLWKHSGEDWRTIKFITYSRRIIFKEDKRITKSLFWNVIIYSHNSSKYKYGSAPFLLTEVGISWHLLKLFQVDKKIIKPPLDCIAPA